MKENKSILFVGVGGQGTILASKLLTEGLLANGYDVKMSEVHGMAQRGGSVSTQVRYGEKVYSPLIEKGKADIIVSFEKSEAVRWLDYLKEGGYVVVNDYEIHPVPVLIGEEEYPQGVKDELQNITDKSIFIDAMAVAKEIGNAKAQNVVLFGALVKAIGLTDIDWDVIIEKVVPAKAIDVNKEAIRRGMEAVK